MSVKDISVYEINDSLNRYWENGGEPGVFLGFDCLSDLYSMKLGCCTDLTGQPTSGKTIFLLNILYNTSILHGWKHVLYVPDAGSKEEVYADLIHIHTGMTFDKRYPNYITKEKLEEGKEFVDKYFKLLIRKPKESVILNNFIADVIEIKNRFDFQTCSIDSWNYLKKGSNQSDVKDLAEQLSIRNEFANEFGIHFINVIHPSKPDKEDLNKPITPYRLMGGSEWYNNGKSIMSVFRPEKSSNRVEVYSFKQKPRVVGKEGVCELYLDISLMRYYELINNEKVYFHPKRELVKQNYVDFDSIIESSKKEWENSEDLPF